MTAQYFFSRVPYFTPISCNYLAAEDSYTLLTLDQVIQSIENKPIAGNTPRTYHELCKSDYNHGILWAPIYIHQIADDHRFINLDNDTAETCREILRDHPDVRWPLARSFIFYFLESNYNDEFHKLVRNNASQKFINRLMSLDTTPLRDKPESFDELENELKNEIFADSTYDDELAHICAAAKADPQMTERLYHAFTNDILPQLTEYNGIIFNNCTFIHQSEAFVGAKYVGNCKEVYIAWLNGKTPHPKETSDYMSNAPTLKNGDKTLTLQPQRHTTVKGLSKLERGLLGHKEPEFELAPHDTQRLMGLIQDRKKRISPALTG